MAGYLEHLLKNRATQSAVNDGEQVDQRLHDSDGKQLALNTNVAHDASLDWDEIPPPTPTPISVGKALSAAVRRARER